MPGEDLESERVNIRRHLSSSQELKVGDIVESITLSGESVSASDGKPITHSAHPPSRVRVCSSTISQQHQFEQDTNKLNATPSAISARLGALSERPIRNDFSQMLPERNSFQNATNLTNISQGPAFYSLQNETPRYIRSIGTLASTKKDDHLTSALQPFLGWSNTDLSPNPLFLPNQTTVQKKAKSADSPNGKS